MSNTLPIIISVIGLILAILGVVLGLVNFFRPVQGGTGTIIGPPGPPGPGGGTPSPRGATGTFDTDCIAANIPTCNELGKLRTLSSLLNITGNGSPSTPYKIKLNNDLITSAKIGVNVDNPSVPLQINGFGTIRPGIYGNDNRLTGFDDINGEFDGDYDLGGSYPCSIMASSSILGSQFWAHSDQRIKDDIQNIGDSLDIIDTLYPKKYKSIDGNKYAFGLIAQEVKKSIPEAIQYKTDFIPNINKRLAFKKMDENTIVMDLSEYDINVDDKIKLIGRDSNTPLIGKVIENKNNKFIIQINSEIENNISDIYVYGKQVNDFHILDYNYLFTLNLDATKKLKSKITELESKIEQLQRK